MKKRLIAIMLSTSLIGGIAATIGSQTTEAATLKSKSRCVTSIIKDNVKDSEVLNLSSDCGVYQRRVIFKKYATSWKVTKEAPRRTLFLVEFVYLSRKPTFFMTLLSVRSEMRCAVSAPFAMHSVRYALSFTMRLKFSRTGVSSSITASPTFVLKSP